MPVAHNMLESEMIGAIKIKDGLFIGDELASTVSHQEAFCVPKCLLTACQMSLAGPPF